MIGDKLKKIKNIEEEVKNCQKCPLFRTRINPVIGEGSLDAKIMFVGEAPGFWEDQKGRPFAGKAGKVLDSLLESISLKREDIYITNLLKCRPPNNRDPKEDEIKMCSPYLDRQIEIIQPKIIATLGRYSMNYIFKKYGLEDKLDSISKIHGRVYRINSLFQSIIIIPLYHPAVATYHPQMFETLKKDFLILAKVLKEI